MAQKYQGLLGLKDDVYIDEGPKDLVLGPRA